MIIICPCCQAAFADDEAQMYKPKTTINNRKPRASMWEYFDLLDEETEAVNPDSCSATNNKLFSST